MIRQYVVDAFAEELFSGNPAAVCVTEEALPDGLMQKIAAENNLSETAFAIREGSEWSLRWFTPACEIDLCGHATLAASAVIMTHYEPSAEKIIYNTLSGKLSVRKRNGLYELDLPAYELRPYPVTQELCDIVGSEVVEACLGRDLLCVLSSEEEVRRISPDSKALLSLDGMLLHVTARGGAYDAVSRSFAPKLGVYEDPVCGSGHCHIVPFWANRLGVSELVCYQASSRGGVLYCALSGDKVSLAGYASFYSREELFV